MNQDALLANIRPDATLDTYGLLCPIPIVKAAGKVRQMLPGSVLEVVATDSGIEVDLANWCKSHKHQYLGCRQEGRVYHAFIKVGEGIKTNHMLNEK